MKLALPSLWVGLGAFVTFWVSFVVSVVRRASAWAAS
jgi:hypothetical protein